MPGCPFFTTKQAHPRQLTCTGRNLTLVRLLQVQIPGPLGMILTGIAIGNINNGHLVRGLPASWSKELRAIALALIFLRSGLEIDMRVSSHAACTYAQIKSLGTLLISKACSNQNHSHHDSLCKVSSLHSALLSHWVEHSCSCTLQAQQ